MAPLATDLFDYSLPDRLVAQAPVERRDGSRLLVVDRATRKIEHRAFGEIGDYLRAGDTFFRNNASVLPARLLARRPTGGTVECLLLRPAGRPNEWRCLLRPGRRLDVGATFEKPGAFRGTVQEKNADGTARVAFEMPDGASVAEMANRFGEVPLPPYIARQHTAEERTADLGRYQTVYADPSRQVAVAAPTAGLHFTPDLLARLEAAGIGSADVTLHVGLGTFQPIATASIEAHAIHREIYELPAATQRALFEPGKGRRIAVGTTTVRSIEDYLSRNEAPSAGADSWTAEATIFIYPPRTFRGVDALVTNFHQPRSTLLCLVSAFLTPGSLDGIAWLKAIYAEAIAREYRFFSYGDAMLIL